uniref:DUF2530 domain-containing protein n=1 Tax=Micromonospora carbonacea TaxID=47853 RepID=A0A7D5Y7F5_9ACTN|nr:hypothetical protein HZU44_11300 [Micromonospora carbonacea]
MREWQEARDARQPPTATEPRQPTPETVPSGQGLLVAAVVFAVAAIVALVISWTADGSAWLVGGIGSVVCGALAVWLAGLWYRRRAPLD